MIDEKLKQRAHTPPCKGDPAPREKILKLGRKITDVDSENKRISLSIRALLEDSEETDAE